MTPGFARAVALQPTEDAMKEIADHKTHELAKDALGAVTGGVGPVPIPYPEPEPTPQPTTYGEAFNMILKAAGGRPR